MDTRSSDLFQEEECVQSLTRLLLLVVAVLSVAVDKEEKRKSEKEMFPQEI